MGASKFRSMENVSRFVGACRDFFGVPEYQLFCTGDLSECRDMQAVVQCLLALGGRIQILYPSWDGPRLGIPGYARSPRLDSQQSPRLENREKDVQDEMTDLCLAPREIEELALRDRCDDVDSPLFKDSA